MIYYTKDGKRVSYNCDTENPMKGKQGVVYRLLDDSSKCLKEYLPDNQVEPMYRNYNRHFDCEMFEYFKSYFGYTSFCKLYDLLFKRDLETVMAYTMKYYEEMIENILDLPVSYLLDNYSLLYDAMVQLANDFVMVIDFHGGSIINTSDGMIVTDFDQYKKSEDGDKDVISFMNRDALLYAFHHMIKIAFRKKGIDVDNNCFLKFRLDEMFEMGRSVSFGITPLSLKRKLAGWAKVKDYFE